MLDSRTIEHKLYDLAAVFNVHMHAKRYSHAKRCYEEARSIVVFIGLEEEKQQELFGIRGDRGNIIQNGLFREDLVQKAYYECCIKAKEQPQTCLLCKQKFMAET